MIITFCGHSNCFFKDDIKEQLKNILVSEIIKNPTCKFYLGGYGDFDGLCLRTLKDLKKYREWFRVIDDEFDNNVDEYYFAVNSN